MYNRARGCIVHTRHIGAEDAILVLDIVCSSGDNGCMGVLDAGTVERSMFGEAARRQG
jgi:hypothetical protein